MARKRSSVNAGLPARWRFIYGAYYYQVPPGLEHLWDDKQTFKLGKNLGEAYKAWTSRVGHIDVGNKLSSMMDRYAMEVIPTKEPITQKSEKKYLKNLRPVFGIMHYDAIEPKHIYKYYSEKNSKSVARKELKLLSHIYTKIVEWGYLNKHPFKFEVRLKSEQPRRRYVEDWEIVECLSLPSFRKKGSIKMMQAYIKIKLLTGMDRKDLLSIRMTDLKEDGIHDTRSKTRKTTGKTTIYEWTQELRVAVDEIVSVRPAISPFLFCTKRGTGYFNEKTGEANGWSSMWQRFMSRLIKETKIIERFIDSDLRAKAASDAESLEHARALLAHADSKITNRVYRRKPEKVKPIR